MDIILENKNLIYSICNHFNENKEDLFQAGCLGMIMAYKNYDPSYSVKFTTYAYPYIIGEIKKYIRENKGIKVSRDISKLYLKIEKANILLSQQLMREPTKYELSSYLEIDIELIDLAINSVIPIESVDKSIDDTDLTLLDVIGKNNNIDDLIMLKDGLKQLNEFERNLIEQRYINDLTQSEVSNNLGISQVQVSRNEQKILKKLRNKIVA